MALGRGPVLVHADSGAHYNVGLTRFVEARAKDAGIAIQHAVFVSFASDGGTLLRAGVPTALVCFPVRYTHSPFEMAHLGDIERLTELLVAVMRTGMPQ